MSRFEYELTEYSASLRGQIVQLHSRAFGWTEACSAAYLEWKYEQNPYLRGPHIFLALLNGRVVGMRGMHGCQWSVGEDAGAQIIPSAGDLAVDRAHRRRGLARRLLEYSQNAMRARGYRLVLNLSANRATRLLQLSGGWRRPVCYQTYRRGSTRERDNSVGEQRQAPLRGIARVHRRIKKLLGKARPDSPFSQFDAWAGRGHDTVVGTSTPRIAEMSKLISGLRDASRIHHVRSEEFYRWRFADPRAHSRVRFLFLDGNRGLDGFLILHRPDTAGPVTILDWAASTPSIWSKLLRAAVEGNAQLLQITSTAFSRAQSRTLRGLGFEPESRTDSRSHPAPGLFLRTCRAKKTMVRCFADFGSLIQTGGTFKWFTPTRIRTSEHQSSSISCIVPRCTPLSSHQTGPQSQFASEISVKVALRDSENVGFHDDFFEAFTLGN